MKQFAALGLAGLASIATAQSVTIHFDVDGDPLAGDIVTASIGETLTWTVYASFEGYSDPGAYFGGFVGSFFATNSSSAVVSNVETMMGNAAIAPLVDGGDINRVNIFNSALLGTNNPTNPLILMTFETEVMSAEGFSYFAEGLSSVFPASSIFTIPDEFTDVEIVSDFIVVPSSGPLALLGLAGLSVVRRRR